MKYIPPRAIKSTRSIPVVYATVAEAKKQTSTERIESVLDSARACQGEKKHITVQNTILRMSSMSTLGWLGRDVGGLHALSSQLYRLDACNEFVMAKMVQHCWMQECTLDKYEVKTIEPNALRSDLSSDVASAILMPGMTGIWDE